MSTNCDRYGIFDRVVPNLLEKLGKVGSSLSRSIRSGNHSRAISVTVNPLGYSDWREFYRDYQAAHLLRKYPSLNLPIIGRP
jgi:hypothetical protein